MSEKTTNDRAGRRFFWRAVCGACLTWTLAARVSLAATTDEKPLFDFRQETLPNGLRVITLEDFSCPVVTVHLWYHVGSKDEQPERQGFAHMFEHMMFRGTDRLGPTDHFDLVRRTGGNCNAYTSFDQTVYHETLPASQLELALWLEAERMAFLKIDQTSYDTERKVVEEERRLGLNRPFGTVSEKVMAELFREHPYQWTPIGKIPHLRSAPVQELRNFWTKYYVPNNATLIVVGAVKHAAAQQLAQRYFAWIPRRDDPPRVSVQEPPLSAARSVTFQEDNAPVPLVGLMFRSPPIGAKDQTALELINAILIGDNSSRVYRELVADKKLAAQVFSFNNDMEQDGVYVAAAVLNPLGGKPDAVLESLQAHVRRLVDEPVSEQELTKARNQLLRNTVVSNLTVEGKAAVLGQAAVLEGDPARANQRLAEIRAVTAADLQRVARQYLASDRTVTMNVPGQDPLGGGKKDSPTAKEDDAPITAEPEKQAPPPGRKGVTRPSNYAAAAPVAPPSAAPAPAAFSTHKLANGLKLITVPNRELPFVSVRLGLMAGASTEEKPGTAALALGMLTKGDARHTEAQLAEELGQWAIELDGTAGMDRSAVSASCLTEQLERTMGLLADVTRTPRFDAEEFEKFRKQTRTDLAVETSQPQYQAQRQLRQRLFGDHPYSRTATGEVEDLDKLALDDLTAWWKKFARPDLAVMILAGDVSDDGRKELALVEKAFGSWQAAGPKPEVKSPAIAPTESTRIYLVNRRTSTQAQIQVGQLGIRRDHPQYFNSLVVNGYFGGAFNSRLNETIRVKKGLTYGARGGFSTNIEAGQFNVSTFSKTESAAEAVQTVLDEIKRLRNEPPSQTELTSTISYLVGSFPIQRETPQQVASDLWTIESEGLPADYFQRQLAGIAATTGENCSQLAQAAVDPERLVIVVVGKAKALQADLEKIAPVTVIDEK